MKTLAFAMLAAAFCGCCTNPLREGLIAEYHLSGDAVEWYCGALDDVLIWNRALSQSEVVDVYSTNAK